MPDSPEETLKVIEQFNHAFNRHDLNAVMALMTDDCIFENTTPPPDGTRYTGNAAVQKAFAEFFESAPYDAFTTEEMFATDNRCVVRWVYRWENGVDSPNYVRGVDVFRLQNGKIAEKLSYVKG